MKVSIGIHVYGEPQQLVATIESVRANTATPFSLLLLPDGPDEATAAVLAGMSDIQQLEAGPASGGAAAFNRLAKNTDSDVVVLLESGARTAPGWLEHILRTLESNPAYGLAGPSTNRCWNEQAVFPNGGPTSDEVMRTAEDAVRRFGETYRTLEPLYSLADFCYVVRRSVFDAIGEADEAYGLGPCWEMDYNIRAARAGFQGVWACAAYVYRSPLTPQRSRQESLYFEAAKQRYQDKFCGLRLSGQKTGYRSHCRGDACPNFAPPKSAPSKLVSLPSVPQEKPHIQASGGMLVSCIMPTSDRRQFVPQAINYFLRQDYPERELIVVDDGRDSVRDLLPQDDDPRVRYFRLDRKLTLGEKRNFACQEARGEIIMHWDDDDWMADHRISYQVAGLRQSQAQICGLDTLLFYEPASGRSWRYVCGVRTRNWAAGGTLCYWKSFWKSNPFPPLTVGEDTRFVWSVRPDKLLVLPDPSFYVAIVHGHNTSPKNTADAQWQAYPTPSIHKLFGQDAAFYGVTDSSRRMSSALVSCIMPTRDRHSYVPHAISYFQRQDYAPRELIVVDDGDDPVSDLMPQDPSIRYIRLESRHTLGEKRNLAVQAARGQFIVHWDDDDWYAPTRLSSQVRSLQEGKADVTALAMRTVLELPHLQFWKCGPRIHARVHHRDVCCGTIAYPRVLWEKFGPYPGVNCGEDVLFLSALGNRARIERVIDESMFICVRHGQNTWRIGPDWHREPTSWERIPAPDFLPPDDLDRYFSLCGQTNQKLGVM